MTVIAYISVVARGRAGGVSRGGEAGGEGGRTIRCVPRATGV